MKPLSSRKSIRLKGYDYSQEGMYFITICCQDRICRFGKIEDGEMILNDFGKIAYDEWVGLSERYPHILLDMFQIMPNHIHSIIVINVGATLAVARNDVTTANDVIARNDVIAANEMIFPNNGLIIPIGATADRATVDRATARVAPTTIGNIIGAYKSLVINKCLAMCKLRNEYLGKLWQRNYYEHIIRDERAYQNIANYILNNPRQWDKDRFRD